METILSSYTNTHRHTWAYWPYKKLINICIYTVRLQLWLIIFTTFLLFEHWDATWQGHYKTPHGRATTRRHMAGPLQDATWQGHYKTPHGRVTTRCHMAGSLQDTIRVSPRWRKSFGWTGQWWHNHMLCTFNDTCSFKRWWRFSDSCSCAMASLLILRLIKRYWRFRLSCSDA